MATNTYDISLTTQPFVKKTAIKVVQGDINANLLQIKIFNNSVEIDYSAIHEVTITFVKPDYRTVQVGVEEGVTVTETGITYTLGVDETVVCGSIKASLQLIGANGERTSVEEFRFEVVPDFITPAAVQSTSAFPVLNRILFEANKTEQEREDNENTRIENEDTRIASETARVTVESERVTAESDRVNAEELRVTAEEGRATAESGRVTAETSRASAESTRATNENSRATAENSRVTADSERTTAESNRATAEGERVTAETVREFAEGLRELSEADRASAESARVTAENTRGTNETARASAETSRVTAESARVTAENARVSAEASRVTAENTRKSQETTRQSNETTRQTQETARQASMADIASRFSTLTTQQQQAAEVIDARKGEVSLRAKIDLIDTQYTDIANKVNTPTYSTPAEATASVISLPSTAVKGQLNVTLKGNTIFSYADNGTDYSKWVIQGTGTTKGVNGVHLVADTASGESAYSPLNLKPSTQYTIVLNIRAINSVDGVLQISSYLTGAAISVTKQVGIQKILITTQATITTNRLQLAWNSATTDGASVDFELYSILEGDWTTKSEVNKSFKSGTVSTLSTRITSIGKNKYGGPFLLKNKLIGDASTGAITNHSSYNTLYLPVKAGEQWTVKGFTNASGAILAYVLYDASGNRVSHASPSSFPNTITIPSGVSFLGYSASNTVTPMVEPGAVSSAYEAPTLTETITPSDTIQRSVPTAKDELNVTTGEKRQKVKQSILNGTENWIWYTTTASTHSCKINNFATDNGALQDTPTSLIGYGKTTYNYTARGNGNVGVSLSLNNVYLDLPIAEVDAMAGADTVAKFKAYLVANPITLNYQLAVSVPTQIEGLSQLIAESNGSIIIEPAVKDVATYGVNIAIGNTALPIKTLERVTKIVINPDNSRTETDIAISTCTIAPDGLSYTSTALALGDKVEYSYLYDSALGTLPTINYSYPMNLKAAVEGNTKMIAQVSKDVSELNDFTVAYLLNIEARLTAHSI